MERYDRPAGAPTRRGPDFALYLTLNDKKLLAHIKFTWGIFLPLSILRLRDLRAENHFYNMDTPIYNLVWNPNDEWDQLGPSNIHLVADLVKPLPPLPPLHTLTLQPAETADQEWGEPVSTFTHFSSVPGKQAAADFAMFLHWFLILPSPHGRVCVYLLNRS